MEYKKHYSTLIDVETINERKERKDITKHGQKKE